jgi:hypothetical protein
MLQADLSACHMCSQMLCGRGNFIALETVTSILTQHAYVKNLRRQCDNIQLYFTLKMLT